MTSYQDAHLSEWRRATHRYSAELIDIVDLIFHEYCFVRTYEREGIATGLNTQSRRVTVNLLPVQRAAGATVFAAYGQPNYSASQIVNKRVRVWERVESRLDERGPTVVSRSYVVDVVLGGQ